MRQKTLNNQPNLFPLVEDKDTNSQPKKLSPVFDELTNPATYVNHIEQLKGKIEAPPHAEILHKLIEQFEPLDFEALAFPKVKKLRERLKKTPEGDQAKNIQKELSDLKMNLKHYLVLSIENVLALAKKNRWGLCKNHDFIYLYNSTFWADIDKETFQKFLGEAAEKMGVGKFSARFYQFREQLFKQFLSTAYLPTPENNKNTVLINLLNGTFEISPRGTKLRPFNSSDFITYQLPFEYNPQAEAPIFEKYLNRVLPDKERQIVLAEYLGYVFIKHGSTAAFKAEKALILYGPGANGKSVFFEIVTAMYGRENVSNYSLQSLTEEKGFYRAKISNKLINYASEINGRLETDLFKIMVSGEPVEACLKYGQPFTMTDYAKLIFNCNELPKEVEHTPAYFRRFLIIPFEVVIPEKEQNKRLHTEIIEKELSGVFNWVLQGLNRLLKQKNFSHCEAAEQALEQYKTKSNSVQIFLNENEYKVSLTNEISLKSMFIEYRNYCIENGYKSCSLQTFADRLRNSGYQTDRKNYGTIVNAQKNTFLFSSSPSSPF